MPSTKIAPYGSWKSPITSDLIIQQAITLQQVVLDGDAIYWTELHPAEQGRLVIMRRTSDGKTVELTPPPFNARTRVHEYGGGAFTVDRGTIYFSNFADQRLYRQDPGFMPRPLTPAVDPSLRSGQTLRYADGVIDRKRNRMICVREDHTVAGEAVNTIVTLDLDGKDAGGRVIVSGNNFYSNPRLSPDGTRLVWLTWNHPNMPWDGCELWVGELNASGEIASSTKIAGGIAESIAQPEWSPDGIVYFISDRSGWWNLYRWRAGQIEPLGERAAEFAGAQWVFGQSFYAFESKNRIVCAFSERGEEHLVMFDTATRALTEIGTPFSDIVRVNAAPGKVILIGGSPTMFPALVQLDLKTRQFNVLRRNSDLTVDPGYLSVPEAIEFPTEHGQTAHAFFYAPKNRDYAAPAGEKPPLLVISHGGPTGSVSNVLALGFQYWTSHGFAIVDVNYGGSTGFGRAYRQRLNGQWGVVDVNDCVNAARYLVKRGDVDGNRVAIRGGSAGGYTTLAALVFTDFFKAGASHFGISELEVFAQTTHKFESRYCDSLVGPYPAQREVYRQRSPINFIDRLSCPLILFQGLEDKIVPPSQSEMMFDAARQKGIPTAYVPFEGEQHGFRQGKNIKRALNAELYFYGKVFGFQLAEHVKPVKIENLPSRRKAVRSRQKASRKKMVGKKRMPARRKPVVKRKKTARR